MTELEKIQAEALRQLLHRLSYPFAGRTHRLPNDLTSEGDYYTTLTFRSDDLNDVLGRARAAVEGKLPEDVEHERLLARMGELNRNRVQLEREIEQAQSKAQEVRAALMKTRPETE